MRWARNAFYNRGTSLAGALHTPLLLAPLPHFPNKNRALQGHALLAAEMSLPASQEMTTTIADRMMGSCGGCVKI